MQSLPLCALIREIKNIDVFLADLATNTHQVSIHCESLALSCADANRHSMQQCNGL